MYRYSLVPILAALLCSTSATNVFAQRSAAPPKPDPRNYPPPEEVSTPDPLVISVDLPAPTAAPGFGVPEGLATKPEILLPCLGYGSPDCFVLTPATCFETAFTCYSRGLFTDALAFCNHGLKMCNHSRLYLLKAVCEMHLGRCQEAGVSITRYRLASRIPAESVGLGPARERINDPMRVRLEYLLNAMR